VLGARNSESEKSYVAQRPPRVNRGEIFTTKGGGHILRLCSGCTAIKNSAGGELVEPCELGVSAVKIGNLMNGKKILLVEDNPVNRRLAVFLLRSQGYEVHEATTAQEAFENIEKERPDLIVMDIQLPGMDGLEVTRRIKAQPATADIPVIAVTSYAMKGDREKALAAGCVGYVTKPIDKNIFIQEITARIGAKQNS